MRLDVSCSLPSEATALLAQLESAGAEAWAVGGFVRDSLLRRGVSDIDIACNAPWQETQRICEAAGFTTHETGTKHGTLTVVVGGMAFEVTTFRIDGIYKDGRHPEKVSFTRNIEEDLARRDFTINAMAYHPDRGLLDPFDGMRDIEARTIRTVGDPEKRFSEDGLRILRACRFSSELGYALDGATFTAMVRNKRLLQAISAERVTHELERLLLGPCAGSALVECVDVLSAVLPELVAMKGFDQKSPYHAYDVLKHTAKVIDGVPPYSLVRWAALFHDAGKPAAFFTDDAGVGHFYDHPAMSVPIARGAMQRLSFSKASMDRVLTLVQHHDDVVQASVKSVRRMIGKLDGDVDLFRSLCDLKRGDARGKAPRIIEAQVEMVDDLERICDELVREGQALRVKDLAISGTDVIALGVKQGPEVGMMLAALFDKVVDESIENTSESLITEARHMMANREKTATETARAKDFSKNLEKGVDESMADK